MLHEEACTSHAAQRSVHERVSAGPCCVHCAGKLGSQQEQSTVSTLHPTTQAHAPPGDIHPEVMRRKLNLHTAGRARGGWRCVRAPWCGPGHGNPFCFPGDCCCSAGEAGGCGRGGGIPGQHHPETVGSGVEGCPFPSRSGTDPRHSWGLLSLPLGWVRAATVCRTGGQHTPVQAQPWILSPESSGIQVCVQICIAQ